MSKALEFGVRFTIAHLPNLARNQSLPAAWGAKEEHAAHVVNAQLLHNMVWENATRKRALENLVIVGEKGTDF